MVKNDGRKNDFGFNNPCVILRALGPPNRDFRVDRFLLSIESPFFEELFPSAQQTAQTTGDVRESNTPEVDILEVTDPAEALDIVLGILCPSKPSPLIEDLDTLAQCLVIATKYGMKRAIKTLHETLSRIYPSQPLRAYAIAFRFKSVDLVESISRYIASSVNLTETTALPEDFKFVPLAARQELFRKRNEYLKVVEKAINQTPLPYWCVECPAGEHFPDMRLKVRLARLVEEGTPMVDPTCLKAYEKKYGRDRCAGRCSTDFISAVIKNTGNGLVEWLLVNSCG